MTERITQAVARQEKTAGPGQLVEQYRAVFEELLPSHISPGTFVRLAQGMLRRNDKLREAAISNPESFLAALAECARLGHEPGTDAFALVPFRSTGGRPEIEGIEMYAGKVERMFRAGAVRAVKCEIVCKNDRFVWRPTQMSLPEHDFDPLATDEERGPLHGVYAYAEMGDGAISQVIVLSRDEVMKHRAAAKTKEIWDSAWEPAMWRKTAVHQLERWVPSSAEWLRVRLRAAAEAQHSQISGAAAGVIAPAPADPADEPVEAEVVDAAPSDTVKHASPYQFKRLNAVFAAAGWGEDAKEQKLQACSVLVGRELHGAGELTNDEAERVISMVGECADLVSLMALLDRVEREQRGNEGD